MPPKYVKIVGKNHSKCMVSFYILLIIVSGNKFLSLVTSLNLIILNHFKAEYVQDCWEKEFHSNVTFVCKDLGSFGKTLCANKAILAAASPKFHRLLSDTGDDEENVTIIVPGNDFHIVKMLLQYIHTGEVLVNSFLDELESLILDWVNNLFCDFTWFTNLNKQQFINYI